MKNIFGTKNFWLLSIVTTTIVFLFASYYHQDYISEIDILALPQNDIVASNIDKITTNIETIAATDSFVSKLESENSAYDFSYSVTRISDSTILKVHTQSADEAVAQEASSKIARQIATTMSNFYNIKNELAIRFVDEPSVRKENWQDDEQDILWSALGGFLLSFIIFWSREKYLASRSHINLPIDLSKVAQTRPNLNLPNLTLEDSVIIQSAKEKTIKEDAPALPQEDLTSTEDLLAENQDAKKNNTANKNPEEKNIADKNEPKLDTNKKSCAPDNLPVGDDLSFAVAKTVCETQVIKSSAEKTDSPTENQNNIATPKSFAPNKHQANEEEIKARLNKLLGAA